MRRRNQHKAKHPSRPVLHALLWPLQGLALALFWAACAAMSPERAAASGARLARWLGPRSRRHGRLRDNLSIALPHASNLEVAATAKEVWGSFGATLAEYAHLRTVADRKFAEHVEVVLHPGAEARRERGEPCVFVTAHLGNWEIAAAACRQFGRPLTVVYSRQANPLTDWLVQRQRRHLRCRLVTTDDGLRPLLEDLQAGCSIGLLVDLRVQSGAAVPFCGQDTTTTLAPARLALKYRCSLVPVRVERLRPAHFRVTAYDPVLPDHGLAPEARARQMMAQVNRLFESWIVERPHEWQCFQNRWPRSTRVRVLRARARREAAACGASPPQAASGGVRSTSSRAS